MHNLSEARFQVVGESHRYRVELAVEFVGQPPETVPGLRRTLAALLCVGKVAGKALQGGEPAPADLLDEFRRDFHAVGDAMVGASRSRLHETFVLLMHGMAGEAQEILFAPTSRPQSPSAAGGDVMVVGKQSQAG